MIERIINNQSNANTNIVILSTFQVTFLTAKFDRKLRAVKNIQGKNSGCYLNHYLANVPLNPQVEKIERKQTDGTHKLVDVPNISNYETIC